jgi:hypothetical protein
MIMKKYIYFLFLCAIFLLFSCKKKEPFSEIPAISFVSFSKINDGSGSDNQGKLTIAFQDGDGDLGLDEGDINPPFDTSSVYYYNFFVDYYKKQNGEFVLLSTMSDSRHARFPRLSDDVPESIEGELSVTLYINTYDFSTVYDTLKLECFIVDRALNHSNVITTPEIVVKKR